MLSDIYELIINALHSTGQAYVGVILIFLYFALIIATAGLRIKRGDHMHH